MLLSDQILIGQTIVVVVLKRGKSFLHSLFLGVGETYVDLMFFIFDINKGMV